MPVCLMVSLSVLFGMITVLSGMFWVNYYNLSKYFKNFEIPKFTIEVGKVAPFAAMFIFCFFGAVKREIVVGSKTIVSVHDCKKTGISQACGLCSNTNVLAKK